MNEKKAMVIVGAGNMFYSDSVREDEMSYHMEAKRTLILVNTGDGIQSTQATRMLGSPSTISIGKAGACANDVNDAKFAMEMSALMAGLIIAPDATTSRYGR